MESKAVVSLANGKKAFGDNEVLKDISLTVNAGDVLAIIGPSGGGKSTLLRCMTLLETLDSGDLSYGDLTVCANDAAGRAVYGGKDVIAAAKTRFGLVFQNFNLFPHYTVLQNVTDALICVQKMPKDEALARGRELLARMGLADKEAMVPCDLSGGQQQRVAIARAMAMNPDVLFFDQPTMWPITSSSWTAASAWSRGRLARSSTTPSTIAPARFWRITIGTRRSLAFSHRLEGGSKTARKRLGGGRRGVRWPMHGRRASLHLRSGWRAYTDWCISVTQA